MGRQAYMNRLALGRSPYEAPEPSEQLQRRSVSAVEADGYVQEYDERGHPTNSASKRLGRELRRAKNDVLSTMGIVVSGEVGNMGVFREKQKTNAVIAENDYGLLMATLDQTLNFLGSWWTLSLGARIQTFRSYTHMPLLQLIRTEIQESGLINFYFAGIPAWMTAFSVSMLRRHLVAPSLKYLQNLIIRNMAEGFLSRLVKHIFSMLQKVAPAIYFAFFEQVYMLSILQALQLVPMSLVPGLRFFVPFTSTSLIRLPTVPSDLSPSSLARFAMQLAGAPYTLLFCYFSLRPFVEARLYRILRRHLPRPDHPDEISIKVALENDFAEWTVPTLGRRSEEEVKRSNFTFAEDIRYEMMILWNWMRSWLGWKDHQSSSCSCGSANSARRERLESIRSRIEQLQRELGYTGGRSRPARSRRRASVSFTRQERTGRSAAAGDSQSRSETTTTPDPQSLFMDQDLPNGGLTQSPTQITPDPPDWLQSPDQTGMDGTSRNSTDAGQLPGIEEDRERTGESNSRSNSLYSLASSSDSSPPNSPRVRASLVHQSSDIITMQLELLSTRQHESSENSQRVVAGQQESFRDRSGASEPMPDHRPDHIRRADEAAATQTVFDEVPREPSVADHDDHPAETTAFPDTVESPPPGVTDDDEPDGDPSSESEDEDDIEAITALEDGQRRRRPSNVTDSNTVQPTSATFDRSKKIRHRVTVLSSHPVDALATRLASLCTTIIFLPLESLYLRSLARTYLSSPLPLVWSPRSNTRSITDIRGLGEWFGGGSAADMGAYIAKMMVVLGMQGAVSMAILRLGSSATLGLGRKWFGWGSL